MLATLYPILQANIHIWELEEQHWVCHVRTSCHDWQVSTASTHDAHAVLVAHDMPLFYLVISLISQSLAAHTAHSSQLKSYILYRNDM